MENYNLTAELKKIASGITSTDPNTELGNINSGVGNLDTAMQGVATAINGISIPNPGSNIDGVATAIGNISIPNTGSNIDGVATAVDNLAGGKDLGDIETILTTMNGNIANLGSNHITNILEAPGTGTGYQVWYGTGNMTPLSNQASKTSYTDTNNIGATNLQSAVDRLSKFDTFASSTYDTSKLDGVVAQRRGYIISVKINIKGGLTARTWFNGVATGLPVEWCPTISIPFVGCRIGSAQDLGKTCSGAIDSNGTVTFIEGGLVVGHEVYIVYII